MEKDEGTIVGQENIKVYVSKFYKKLFGASATNNFSLIETKNHDMPQLSSQENEILTTRFTEKEIHDDANGKEQSPGTRRVSS